MKNRISVPAKTTASQLQTKSIDSLVKLLDSSLDVICAIDEFGHFLTVSAASRNLWGYEPEELEGRPYLELVIEDDRAMTEVAADHVMAGHPLTNFENHYRRKDGSIIPMVWSATWDEKERIMYCVARDASEKQRVEKQLRIAHKKAKSFAKKTNEILESMQDGFFTMDRRWRVTYFNQMAEQLTGKTKNEMLGRVFWDIFPGTVGGLAYREYHRAMEENVPVNFEMYSQLYGDWFEVSGYPSKCGISVYFKNISVRKKQEQELQRLSMVAKETVNAVVITDKEERITWVNPAFTNITEYTYEEAIGKKPSELLQGKNTSPKTKAYLRGQISKKQPFECDVINYSKSGREYWVELKGQPIMNEHGEVEQFFAIQTDITERIELQKMVIEEKVEAQKEITKAMIQVQEKERSEIGKELHDNVNQLIATIKLYLESIRNYPEYRDMFVDKGIELTKKAMDESRSLSHRLVTPVMADFGFRASVEELLSHYQLLSVFSIDFEFTVCEEKLEKSIRLAIYRVVQECLSNIVKYAKATHVRVAILYEDHLVKVIIEDDGTGFDSSAKSGGIGFNNIKNRASLFKGQVLVNSSPGRGCSVKVFFPTINDQIISM